MDALLQSAVWQGYPGSVRKEGKSFKSLLWQVINPLKTSGFLSATRGAKGGYVLGQRPNDITMLDVLTTLEGPISILKCLTHEDACPRIHSCVARTVWAEVNQAVGKALSNITLAEVLSRCAHSSEADNYAI